MCIFTTPALHNPPQTEPFLFDDMSAVLADSLERVVKAVAALLREHPTMKLSVEGHADPREGICEEKNVTMESSSSSSSASQTQK